MKRTSLDTAVSKEVLPETFYNHDRKEGGKREKSIISEKKKDANSKTKRLLLKRVQQLLDHSAPHLLNALDTIQHLRRSSTSSKWVIRLKTSMGSSRKERYSTLILFPIVNRVVSECLWRWMREEGFDLYSFVHLSCLYICTKYRTAHLFTYLLFGDLSCFPRSNPFQNYPITFYLFLPHVKLVYYRFSNSSVE